MIFSKDGNPFYVIGNHPSGGRLSIRFWKTVYTNALDIGYRVRFGDFSVDGITEKEVKEAIKGLGPVEWTGGSGAATHRSVQGYARVSGSGLTVGIITEELAEREAWMRLYQHIRTMLPPVKFFQTEAEFLSMVNQLIKDLLSEVTMVALVHPVKVEMNLGNSYLIKETSKGLHGGPQAPIPSTPEKVYMEPTAAECGL